MQGAFCGLFLQGRLGRDLGASVSFRNFFLVLCLFTECIHIALQGHALGIVFFMFHFFLIDIETYLLVSEHFLRPAEALFQVFPLMCC